MYAFTEQLNLTLPSAVGAAITTPGAWICCSGTQGGIIPAGTTVDSYLLRYAPATALEGFTGRQLTAEIAFSTGETIIGIIVGSTNIANTDALLGAPGTLYPPSTYSMGGLENFNDEVILSADRSTVFVNLHVAPGNMDMIRILTEVPEPADFLLLGSGLAALGFFGRRLRASRAKS